MILGRATHALLRWRLECGERIGVLDTLAASTSLTSTVVSQFQLRTISAFGIALMLVWALSPIGGQASLRQMTIGTKNTTFPATFSYLVHNGYTTGFLNTDRESLWQTVDSIFLSGIIASAASRSSPRDNWGNVKIPRVEYYENKASPGHDGWFETIDVSSDIYTSMIGIPISGTDSFDFIDYQTHIQTSYLHILCSQELKNQHNYELFNLTQPGMEQVVGPGAAILTENGILKLRALRSPESLSPLQFQYITRHFSNNDYKLVCNLTSSYVEAQVHCARSTSCTVNRIRRSQLNSLPPAWTLLDLGMMYPDLLFQKILDSGRNRPQSPTSLDKYLSDPASVLLPGEPSAGLSVPLTDEANYPIRLTQLFNSYFTTMNGIYAIAGGLTQQTAYFWDKNISFVPQGALAETDKPPAPNSTRWSWFTMLDQGKLTAKAWPAEGTKAVSTQVIVAHMAWVVTLCVTSILLIVASLISPLVQFFLLKGPDVMMNISSLATRHNPYIPLPKGGTNLGASDRARLLKGLELRFGDVEMGSGVGHLAIGTVGAKGDEEISRIHKGRLYE
jgi:hypothetical protein